MRLNTSIKSSIKYDNSILVWVEELAHLRQTKDPKVEWCVDGVLQDTYSSDSILHAVDMRLGTYKAGNDFRPAFVVIPKEHLVAYEEAPPTIVDTLKEFFQGLFA